MLLLPHFSATLFMVDVIWFVQVVHYPLVAKAGRSEFGVYKQQNMALTTWILAPPMLLELATAVLLFWIKPTGGSTGQLAIGLALLVVIRLWIRTIAWSLRALLVLWMAMSSLT
jgi:hypothetical protein